MPVVAVGAIGAVIAALLALLILYGIAALAKVVGNLAPDWSIPGLGNIRTHIVGAAQSALRATVGWLDSAAGAAAGWVLAPWHVIRVFMDQVAGLAGATYQLGSRLLHFAQHAYNVAIAWASAKALEAIHFAQHVYNLAHAEVAAARSWALHTIQHVYNLVIAYAAAKALEVVHFAQHVYNLAHAEAVAAEAGAIHFAQHVYNIAHAEITDALARAEHYARTVALSTATAVVGTLSTDIAHVSHAAWVSITDDVKALEGVIATDLPDIGALARAIPRAVPADLAAVIAGGLAIDRLAIRYLRECGIPNCKNLGGFGRLLQDLIGVVETGAILLLVEQAARDPQGTAREFDHLVGGSIRDGAGLARELIGV